MFRPITGHHQVPLKNYIVKVLIQFLQKLQKLYEHFYSIVFKIKSDDGQW